MTLCLTEVGACSHVEDYTYEFSREHITEVLGIIPTVRDARVEEVLEDVDEDHIPNEHQSTLDMVSEEGVSDGDEEGESGDDDGGQDGEGDETNG